MAKRKACTSCKMFVEEDTCPNCKGNQFSTNWQGHMFIGNASKSLIAQKLNVSMAGEYAIKVK
jgi:DNA-directed RNA polymerase subunit E"